MSGFAAHLLSRETVAANRSVLGVISAPSETKKKTSPEKQKLVFMDVLLLLLLLLDDTHINQGTHLSSLHVSSHAMLQYKKQRSHFCQNLPQECCLFRRPALILWGPVCAFQGRNAKNGNVAAQIHHTGHGRQ